MKARDEQQPRYGRQHAANDIGEKLHLARIDPGQLSRLLITADGIDPAAKNGVFQNQVRQGRNGQQDEHRHRHAKNAPVAHGNKRARNFTHRIPVFDHQHDTPTDPQHAQSHDEGRDARKRHDGAVDRPDGRSGEQPHQPRCQRMNSRRHRQPAGKSAQTDGRAHREIDAAGENHEENSQRNDRRQRNLPADQVEIAKGRKVRFENRNEDHQRQQRQKNARFAPVQERGQKTPARRLGCGLNLGLHYLAAACAG